MVIVMYFALYTNIKKNYSSNINSWDRFFRIFKENKVIRTCACFHIIHIIFCLFITPLYLVYISNYMGLEIHKNKKKFEDLDNSKAALYFFYSVSRGLLMFPYIILFFPFMVILLLPSIFSYIIFFAFFLNIQYKYVPCIYFIQH